jgi:hypothetical protein
MSAALASINEAVKAHWRPGAIILGLLLVAGAVFVVPRQIWTRDSAFDAIQSGTGFRSFAVQGTRSPCPADFGYYAFGYSFDGRVGEHWISGVVCWSLFKHRWEWRFDAPDQSLNSDPNRI